MLGDARWQEAKLLIDQALDLPPEGRPAFLEQACDDSELRRMVDELLSEDNREDFLDRPAFKLDRSTVAAERQSIAGYRLLRRLGSGGMGDVYKAERSDADFDQQVAVKLIKRGMDTDEIVHRFRAERRILAGLVHPNIARLLDGGTTEDGLPFLVMEYVDGERLDVYCTERRLSTAQRLELFLEVCSAVQLAHSHLVVHRDIKPGNILVTDGGTPKLLDFGIAKLLQNEDGGTVTVTQPAGRRMTPAYASPEQISGETITTLSDVYSLGVLLFEMLTGKLPFATADRVQGSERLRTPPPNASRTVTDSGGETRFCRSGEDPKKLRRELIGDIDAILVKAMAPETAERYASVAELSEDVHRHLQGRPIRARPPSRLYRTGKYLRRHRKELTAAVTLLALVVSLVVLGLERRNAAAEHQRAEKEFENGQKLTRFVVDLMLSADSISSAGNQLQPEEMLERSAAKAREYFEDSPATRAAVLHGIGGILYNRGQYERARDYFLESLSLGRQVFAPQDWRIGASLNDVAFAYRALDDFANAERYFSEALDRPHFGPEGDPGMAALVMNNLGQALRDQGKLAEAVEVAREALAIRRRHYENKDHLRIAESLGDLAVALRQTGRYDEAEALYREALAMRRRLNPDEICGYSTSLGNLGKLLCERGRFEEGEAKLRESLAMRRTVYEGIDHPDLAHTMRELGVCRQLQGDLDEAEALYRSAAAILERRHEEDRSLFGVALRELASLQLARGEAEQAAATARRSLDVYRRSLSPNHWRIADAESVLGGCLLALGRTNEAAPLIESGYRGVAAVRGDATREVREARRRLEDLEALSGTSTPTFESAPPR